jgi:hypothetical protein
MTTLWNAMQQFKIRQEIGTIFSIKELELPVTGMIYEYLLLFTTKPPK